MELLFSSVKRTIFTKCEDMSALLANAASLYAIILNELRSSLVMRMDTLFSCMLLIALFKRFQC